MSCLTEERVDGDVYLPALGEEGIEDAEDVSEAGVGAFGEVEELVVGTGFGEQVIKFERIVADDILGAGDEEERRQVSLTDHHSRVEEIRAIGLLLLVRRSDDVLEEREHITARGIEHDRDECRGTERDTRGLHAKRLLQVLAALYRQSKEREQCSRRVTGEVATAEIKSVLLAMIANETQRHHNIGNLVYEGGIGQAAVTEANDSIARACPLVVKRCIDCLVRSKKSASMNIDDDRQIAVDTVRTVDVHQVLRRAIRDIGNIRLHRQPGRIEFQPAQTAGIKTLKQKATEAGEKTGEHGVRCKVYGVRCTV